MATIRTLEKGTANILPHRTEVDATYQFIEDGDGNILLHLATYGSDQRVSEKKVSQTLQLDKKTALQLTRIIIERFGNQLG